MLLEMALLPGSSCARMARSPALGVPEFPVLERHAGWLLLL